MLEGLARCRVPGPRLCVGMKKKRGRRTQLFSDNDALKKSCVPLPFPLPGNHPLLLGLMRLLPALEAALNALAK
jgi:hypothetical protein